MKTRRAMLSGTWYSGTASGCRQEIEFFIKNSTVLPDPSCPVVGGIVPHAGWSYSGSIACDVIRLLSSGDFFAGCPGDFWNPFVSGGTHYHHERRRLGNPFGEYRHS